jgi:uncharacterized protein (DUF58 family)
MDRERLLKKVRTIELQMRGMTEHVFSGQYQSAFKGRGMSFSEVRNYQIGDDVRAIDWNVTARFREPYVKVFEEERELTVMLIVDVSGSMYFGRGEDSKLSTAVEALATLGFSAAKKNDRMGALFVSDQFEYYIPPKKGFGHVHFLIRKLIDFKPKSLKTNLAEGLKQARTLMKQRSICFIMSDFTDLTAIKDGLGATSGKHDVVALHVTDPAESELPSLGFVRWVNSEDGTTTWVDSSDPKIQANYKNKQTEHIRRNEEMFRQLNIDACFVTVGEPIHQALFTLFKKHK